MSVRVFPDQLAIQVGFLASSGLVQLEMPRGLRVIPDSLKISISCKFLNEGLLIFGI